MIRGFIPVEEGTIQLEPFSIGTFHGEVSQLACKSAKHNRGQVIIRSDPQQSSRMITGLWKEPLKLLAAPGIARNHKLQRTSETCSNQTGDNNEDGRLRIYGQERKGKEPNRSKEKEQTGKELRKRR